MSRGAPKSLRNGGQSPNFTCYEQITNHFGVPHLAESRVIKQRQEVTNGQPKAAFIVNRQISHTKLAGESKIALQELGLPIFQSSTSQRIAYAFAASNGKTVLDTEPEGVATKEVCAIAHELKEFAK